MDDSTCSNFNIERVDDTQDSIDPSLISESCSSYYERGDQGYICKVCEHHYASRRYVLFHLTNSHSIPTHSWPTCNLCGKIFTKPSKLAVHILSHPKKKSTQDTDTPETSFVSSTPIAAPVIKVYKQSTPDRNRNKLKILTPKVLSVYFIRYSLPTSYKQNPYKCGKCFKSFLTATSREIHRDFIHKTVIGSGCNNSINSKAKSKRKKSNRKSINLNFPSKLKNYKHKHSSQSASKSPHKSPLSKKPSLPQGNATPQEDGGKQTGIQSKLDFSSHIQSPLPSKPVVKRKSSSPHVESVPKSSKRVSSQSQEQESNGTPKARVRSEEKVPLSLPLVVPFGYDIVMDDMPSDL